MFGVLVLLYFLSLFGFLTNVIIYPGFLMNRLGVSPFFIFAVLAAMWVYVSFFLKQKRDKNYFKAFFRFNRLVLVVSLGLSVLFAVLEAANYHNFVYSNFNLYYFDLAFVFLLAYLMFLFQLGKQQVVHNHNTHLLKFSLVLLFVFAVVSTRSDSFLKVLTDEDGLVEYAQAGFYFASAVISLVIFSLFRKSGRAGMALVYLFVSVVSLFTAMEELSWGQRILGLETPESVQQANVSEEINIHNMPLFYEKQYLVYALISFYGSFSWLIHIRFLKKKLGKVLDYITPPSYLFFFFFPTFLYNTYYVYSVGTYDELEEFLEFMLALGIFIFVLGNYFKLKKNTGKLT